jgi:hypothetical protein
VHWTGQVPDSKGAWEKTLSCGTTTNHLIGDMVPNAIACKNYKRVVLANILVWVDVERI